MRGVWCINGRITFCSVTLVVVPDSYERRVDRRPMGVAVQFTEPVRRAWMGHRRANHHCVFPANL